MLRKIITKVIIYATRTISLVRPIPLAGGLAIIMRLRLPFWVFSVHEPRARDCRWVSTSKNPSPQSHAADRRSERHTSFYDGRSLTDDGSGEKNSPGSGRNRGGFALPGPASGFSRREYVTVLEEKAAIQARERSDPQFEARQAATSDALLTSLVEIPPRNS